LLALLCFIIIIDLFLNSASELLKFITEKATSDPSVAEIYLHVQINNLNAKRFYVSHGFSEIEIVKEYYKNIEPADCFLLKKTISR
jgi:ribosomal protein S18 acetylase RimI-like enzyme